MLIFLWRTAAIALGFCMDQLIGDPAKMPHMIRLIGALITRMEGFLLKRFLRERAQELRAGRWLVALVLFISAGAVAGVLALGYAASLYLGFALEALLCFQLLAAKSLRVESMRVYERLRADDLAGARKAVSMIVGRDTAALDKSGVTRAAVETVAENTSDGVVAPLFYMLLGGGVLGCLYKAANTMDSMVGYKSDTYLYFGRAAARLDDALNYIPARLAARLMLLASALCGMDFQNARLIYRRDKRNHSSPNAAHTEAVCAGALGLRLAGDAFYFGRLVKKPAIGDPVRPIEAEDIRRANRLMNGAAWLMLALVLAISLLVIGGWMYATV
ncbi:MAG: adenosylcobinamide-phosphate synthase CbiB [Clostridiales bacterium]|jgi:adenosylcobinamide-phosphate synthase|nr:adenosylcobinamide-phosphate synthase CbiB [Clostridiales bacterium]